MAIESFGKTWWGEQWLASLTNIDYSNRLPRGKTYARRGRVSELEMKNGKIIAYVDGSRSRPYKVTLWMDKFGEKDMNALIDKIMKFPTTVSKLLNGKMDPLLLRLAEETGLMIFPAESKDMGMECSCPDWAVPCKHIAAVIYKVCKDIDNNPFVLFQFRDTDLVQLLLQKNIDVYAYQKQSIDQYDAFLGQHIYSKKDEKHSVAVTDFSQLKDRSEEFFHLLEANPPFFPYGDFKKVYITIINKIRKKAGQVLTYKKPLSSYFDEKKASIFEADAPVHCSWRKGVLSILPISWSDLWELTPQVIEQSHPSVGHHHELLKLALHCVAKGLIAPKIVEKNGQYAILWLPALLDEQLAKTIAGIKPEYGVLLEDNRGEKADAFLSLALLITHIIHQFYPYDFKAQVQENVFFDGYASPFSAMSEESFPISIAQWLKLFEFDLGDYFPILEINEKGENNFMVDINIGDKTAVLAKPKSLADFVTKTKDQIQLFDIYKDLDLLSTYMNKVDRYINSKGEEAMLYDNQTFPHFLFNISPVMALLGIKVVLPKSLQYLIKPKPSIRVSSSSNTSSGVLGLANLLTFDWRISLGNELVSYQDFLNLIKDASGLTKYKGQYIYIDENELLKLNKHFQKPPHLSNVDVLRIALAGEIDGTPIQLSDESQSLIKELTDYDLIQPPVQLKANLRPYQHRGYSWLVKNARIGVGSIIADDMGLGKTLQVIAFLGYLIEQGLLGDKKIIIIVPTSLIPNWENEFSKFMPNLDIFTYYGPNRSIDAVKDHQIILTSYGNTRSDQAKLKKIKWGISVIDESQNIKNPTAQQTKAIKSLRADHNIAMSGTPVENRLMDYWSVMDYANKGLLGNQSRFRKDYELPIARDHNEEVLQRFLNITSPFLLRRMKTDKSIISDLPDKIVQDTFSTLMPEQAALYQKVVDEALKLITEEDTEAPNGLFKRSGLVLQMILSLKQICNHPAQWLKNDIISPELSGKTSLLIDTIRSIVDAGEKVLVFTQFRQMGDILEANLKEVLGLQSLWLHGGVSLKKRKQMVEDFQSLAHKKVMILSLKAGGTGLNLTAANHVIHYDLWWNPAVEAQATDRAFRIGQKRNVMVHRFITKNTFEEKINDLINTKKDLAKLTVGSGEKWIGELSNREIGELFKIG